MSYYYETDINLVGFLINSFQCTCVFYLVGHTQTKKTQTPNKVGKPKKIPNEIKSWKPII